MQTVFANCDKCGKEIEYGQKYFCISLTCESATKNPNTFEDEIDVSEAEELATLCKKCGNIFNSKNIQSVIKAIPFNDKNTIDN